MTHESVLLHEAVEGLGIKPGSTIVDCTLGGGGHSLEIRRRFGDSVRLIGLDVDPDAIVRSTKRLADEGHAMEAANASFRDIDAALDGLGVGEIDGALMDLGLSSNQIEESGRGFTFQKDEPLLMTMGKDAPAGGFTAYDIANSWDEENIATILRSYGDERFAGRIARGIVRARERKALETTGDLVRTIVESVPAAYRHGRIHPATRTFQAMRIAVNDELGALREGLDKAFARLRPGGRLSVISFHSGEDRIVKNFFRDKAKSGEAELVTKKPLSAGEEETGRNPRARSAKLRIISKLR